MCTSSKKQPTPARVNPVPVIGPALLRLSDAARGQLSGQGTGVSSLMINSDRSLPSRTSSINPDESTSLNIKGGMPSTDRINQASRIANSDSKLLRKAGNKALQKFQQDYEKQLRIRVSE